MFRWKMLLMAVMAIGLNAAPASAAFSLRVQVYDGSNALQYDSTTIADNSAADGNGEFHEIFKSLSAATAGGVKITTSGTSSSSLIPPEMGMVGTTETNISNTSGSDRRVVITYTETAYLATVTDPDNEIQGFGGMGSLNYVLTSIAPINSQTSPSGLTSGATASVTTKVLNYGGTNPADQTMSLTGPVTSIPAQNQWSAPLAFTRGSDNFGITTVVEFQLANGASASIQTNSVVQAPAPAGAVLFASALPFVGLLRLRRRLTKAEVATAA